MSRMMLGLVSASVLAAGVTTAQAQDPILDRGDSVVTGFSGIRPSEKPLPPGANPLDHFFIDLNGPSAQIFSMSGLGGRPAGQFVSPAAKRQIKAGDIGQVFAITLDDGLGNKTPNIYLGATAAYGIHIVKSDANGDPVRIKKGEAGARFMDGQHGPSPEGNPGTIWRIDGASGEISAFTTIPGNSGPGIGDVVFDKRSRHFYASDLDQGLIHRVGADGTVIDSFDHGVDGRPAKGLAAVADDGNVMDITNPSFDSEDPSTWGFTQKDRMVYGMAIHNGRLYYAVAGGLQVWSVGLGDDGSFSGDPRWELDATALTGPGPITDMAFDKQGRMVLAQRGQQRGSYDYSVFAEAGQSAVVRYTLEQPEDPSTESIWQAVANDYAIGMPAEHKFADGGIALGYAHDENGSPLPGTCSTMLWSTGSRLRASDKPNEVDAGDVTQADVHGFQGNDLSLFRPQNVPPAQAYYADYDGLFGDAEKAGHLGDIEIWQPCDDVQFGQTDASLPPGYLPPGEPPELPPEFPPPTGEYNTNLELTKRALLPTCLPWGGGHACFYQVRVRNVGTQNYFAPLLVADQFPALPAGSFVGTNGGGWACFGAGPDAFKCWRPLTFLAPGASVSFNVGVFVPGTYQLCHLQNTARIEWAPGGTQWNTDPLDDFDSATALIPNENCPPPVGETNLTLTKSAVPEQCAEAGDGFRCQYLVEVENTGGATYSGLIRVREQPLAGTTALFDWPCLTAGGISECTHPPVNLLPGQKVFLSVAVDVPMDVARANQCEIPNQAQIIFAPGGSFQNINPADDADQATAFVPAGFCTQQALPVTKSCPPGYNLTNGKCEPKGRRCPPGTVGKYPDCRTPVVEPPKVCPPGTVGRWPNCRRIVRPECPRGTVGRYPNCREIVRPKCPRGTVGRYPNCREIVRPKCPRGTVGKFPNCRKIVRPKCPRGTVGKFPNCRKIVRPKCPRGTVGKFPNCRKIVRPKCPRGTVGKFPNCRKIVRPKCPRGTVGKFPNCRKIVRPKCPRGTVGRFPNCKRPGHGQTTRPRPSQIKRNNQLR